MIVAPIQVSLLMLFIMSGHGLDANTGGIHDGAFSEGLGDIMLSPL